jgi:nicotinamidase-related amidase
MLTLQGREIPETLSEIVDPRHTAVIVHDTQNDNTAKGGNYDKAGHRIDISHFLGPLVKFLGHARRHHAKVMYTQYTHLPNFATYTDPQIRKEYTILSDSDKRWTRDDLLDGTWGWQTIDELRPEPEDIIIRKYRVDAFLCTPLEVLLRLNRIKTIVQTGIATEVGILPTAWHALNLGFFVVVPEDCVGAMEPQYHEDAMRFLRRLAIVKNSSEIVDAWQAAVPAVNR